MQVQQAVIEPAAASASHAGATASASPFETGNIVQLSFADVGVTLPGLFYVQVIERGEHRGNVVLFDTASKTSLRVGPDGRVDTAGGLGVWAQFVPQERAPGSGLYGLRSEGNAAKTNRRGSPGWYLSCTAAGQLVGDAGLEDSAIAVTVVRHVPAALRDTVRARAPGLEGQDARGAREVRTGSVVLLQSADTHTPMAMPLYVQALPDSELILLAQCDGSKATLCIEPSGEVHFNGGYGEGSQFLVRFVSTVGKTDAPARALCADAAVTLRLASTRVMPAGIQPYVAMRPDGALFASASETGECVFLVQVLANVVSAIDELIRTAASARGPAVVLSDEALIQFYLDGFMHVPGVVPQSLVDEALGAINCALGNPRSWRHNVDHDSWELVGQDGALGSHPALLALLYKSPAFGYAQALLGAKRVSTPRGCQIAVRMPNKAHRVEGKSGWHIDGMDKGHFSPFTLLLGICLSDQCGPDWGCLTVFPGSHHLMGERLLHAAFAIRDDPRFGDMPLTDRAPINLGPYIAGELDGALPVQGKAGDVIIAHHKTAHRVAHNHSPHIRYQVYFRLRASTADTALGNLATVEDIWCEFDPRVRALVASMNGGK